MSSHSKGRAVGVLPVNAAARKTAVAQSASKSSNRTAAPRLRLIIRRLPPGLTESEFWTILGDEWRVNNGKVEWAAYKEGKVSRDPAKPSRPARAYLKVKEQSLLDTLSKVLKEMTFQDAKNTIRDSCLLGPPTLEFAPYNKTPSGRVRQDSRQGTIDQDQEFIDFLQSLTEPITKPGANGAELTETKPEAVTVTPLVQYIKEKKANKAKEAAQAKAAKSASKEAKPAKNERPPTVIIKGRAASTAAEKEKEKERVAKATQDALKAVQKSVAAVQAKQASTPAKAEPKQPTTKETQPLAQSAKQERNREPRDNARGAARMLQRDLGLLVKGSTTPRTPKATSSTSSAAAQTTSSTPASSAKPSEPAPPQQKPSTLSTLSATPTGPPTGPRASRTPAAATPSTAKQPPTAPSQAPPSQPQAQPQRQSKPQPSPPQPSPGAKSAFLKHANPSQGITEDLLREAFKPFGTTTRCEIDKKKGLGYVDFADHEGLKKAMASSPVKVANGQVVVLENKSVQGKRGGSGSGSGQGNNNQGAGAQKPTPAGNTKSTTPSAVSSPRPSLAIPAATAAATAQVPSMQSQTPATPTTPATPSTPSAATAIPPTAPRGTPRGGGGGGRGGGRANPRGQGAGQAQGTGQAQNQNQGSVGRQGFRGGRGNFRGGARGGGGGGSSAAAANSSAVPAAGGGEGSAAAAGGSSSVSAPAPTPAATAKDDVKKG